MIWKSHETQLTVDIPLAKVGGHVGFDNVQGISKHGQHKGDIAIASVITLGFNQRFRVIFGIRVGKAEQAVLVGVAVLVVEYVVLAVKINGGSQGGVNHGDFPILAVVGLSGAGENGAVKSGFGRCVDVFGEMAGNGNAVL